jgi:hypothetical protein
MKRLALFSTLLLVVAMTATAYAEVQNVKVSGEVTVRGIYRDAYDLDDQDGNTSDSDNGAGATADVGGTEDSSAGSSDSDNFFASQIKVRVDADLTDMVSSRIELANQRDWDDTGGTGTDTDEFDVGVTLASITLKEFIYTPLTLTVGRQALWLGDGFVVGRKLRDPENSFSADEFSVYENFDAIRATLDYDPITVDLIYSKIDEGTGLDISTSATDDRDATINEDDTDLWIVNVGYQFADYNAEMEAYFIYLDDRSQGLSQTLVDNAGQADEISTLGVRGSLEPKENLNLRGELAVQWGDVGDSDKNRQAWATDIRAEYTLPDKFWTPTLGAELVFYSGEEAAGDDRTGGTGDFQAWNQIFRGNFHSAIREFQGNFYATDDPDDPTAGTNQLQLILDAQLRPSDDLSIVARYINFTFDEEPVKGRDDSAGDEIDLQLNYAYTEDVTFSLIAAWFFPGDYYSGGVVADGTAGARSDDRATELVGSLTLQF